MEDKTVTTKRYKKIKQKFPLDTIRHSTSHLMAAAIKNLYPGVKFGVGPAFGNGFYYDIVLPESQKFSLEDLPIIEAEMNRIKKQKYPLTKTMVPINEAIQFMVNQNQTYKVELLNLLKTKGSTAVSKELKDESVVESTEDLQEITEVSMYQLGDFVDLCRGPHVDHTGNTGAFKLNNITSAYWRGNQENDSMYRIYGLCFYTQQEVLDEEKRLEDLKECDHRHLGQKHKLFFFEPDNVGVGLSMWTPKGTVLRKELEWLAMQYERFDHYLNVATPEIAREEIYKRSGHLPYYEDDMYSPIDIEGEKYRLRPMNCPHHHMIFKSEPRSYRDLPLRFAEHGKVFRFEASGTLSGLMRTRGFTQNDSHMYCTYDQAKEVFIEVMKLHMKYYDLLGIKKYYMRLSLPDMNQLDKYVNEPEKWKAALAIVYEAMSESGCEYKESEGEAAFYGPKIDFQVFNSLGKEYTISTNQLDFLATSKFDLTYTGQDGKEHPVYVVHRTPLGSHERFIAFLLEHFKGAFPTWLAPIHAKILTVTKDQMDYARTVNEYLFNANVRTATGGLRIELDESDLRLQKKIFNAQQEKVPYIIVLGNKEKENQTLNVRLRNGKTIALSVDEFVKRIKYEIVNRLDYSSEENPHYEKKTKRIFSDFFATASQSSSMMSSVKENQSEINLKI